MSLGVLFLSCKLSGPFAKLDRSVSIGLAAERTRRHDAVAACHVYDDVQVIC